MRLERQVHSVTEGLLCRAEAPGLQSIADGEKLERTEW